MLNYNHLHYFHVSATEGSVAAAAQRLRVTQPTVSEQLRSLERTLGVSLFDRLPTGLKLTEAGRLAFEHTSVMFRASERLVQSLGQGGVDLPRTLRVGISSAVSRATTTDFLMPLLALEGCMPTIWTSDSVDLLRDLRANELDLVLCESEPPENARQGIECAMIDTITLVAVAPPSVEPSPDWQNLRMVQYRANSTYRWDIETFLEESGFHPKIAGEADDALFLVEASARGGYLSFVPRSVARDAIANDRLRVLAEVSTSTTGVHAMYSDGHAADLARRAVEVLIQHVRALHDN